jgi:hypothetical protein
VLSLGYTDDGYKDNSYSAHDNGDNDQCKGVGNAFVLLTITTPAKPIQQNFVTSRISGLHWFRLDRKDSKDDVWDTSGYMCVVHNPGCGGKGNDGTDVLFDSGERLPAGVTVQRADYFAQPPHEYPANDSGGIGGYGSYGTTASPQPFNQLSPTTSFRWYNTCVSTYEDQNNYYWVSLVVSAPEGMFLADTPGDPRTSPPQCAPNAFLNPVDGTSAPTSAKTSGVVFSVDACNSTNQPTVATLVISAVCKPPQTASAGASCSMNETIKSTLPPGGSSPAHASFPTQTNYQEGQWTLTKATLNNVALSPLPGPFSIPDSLGLPLLKFSSGTCPIQ